MDWNLKGLWEILAETSKLSLRHFYNPVSHAKYFFELRDFSELDKKDKPEVRR